MKHIKKKLFLFLTLLVFAISSTNLGIDTNYQTMFPFLNILSVHAEEMEEEGESDKTETTTFSIPIYHKHTGSSAGGGCYGAKKTRTETYEVECGGTMIYYPSTDTTGCANCGAGYHGDQSFRKCWHSETHTKTVTYYDINCGKTGNQTGTITVAKSTDQWTKELELSVTVENYGDIQLTEAPYIWNEIPITEPIYRVTENGIYTLELGADANTNTKDSIINIDIKNIDHTPPVMDSPIFSNTEWTKENIILTLVNVQDLQPDGTQGCGLSVTPYSYDMGVTYTGEDFVEIEQSGNHIIRLQDALGNEAEYSITVSNIDKKGPTFTVIDYNKEENLTENIITVEAIDYQPDDSIGCGLDQLPFSFDEGKTWEANNQWTVKKNGTYSVWVKDVLGNITVTEVIIDNIDTFGPKVDYGIDPSAWTNRSVKLRFYVTDVQPKGTPGIGLPAAFISWDGGKTWGNNTTGSYSENQNITVWCRDAYGNKTVCTAEISNIDCDNPWMEAWADTETLKKGESTLLHVKAGDYGCGLAERPFSFDGGVTWTDVPQWEVTEPGNYPIFVVDKVGNREYRYVEIKETVFQIPVIEPPTEEPSTEEFPTEEPSTEESSTELLKKELPKEEETEESTEELLTEEETEETVTMPILEIEPQKQQVVTVEKKVPFWQEKEFMLLVILLCILLFLAALIVLYYFLYGTAKIYNLQEEQEYQYLGRIWINKKEGEHYLFLSQELIDKSCTTLYKIVPGSMFAKLHEEEKLWLDFGHNYETFATIDREILAKNHVATSIKL